MIYSSFLKQRRSESMINTHSQALIAKHAQLDAEILSESHRPRPDETLLHALKKQKLRLKEAIVRLT